MPTAAKLEAVRRVIAAAPDAALQTLALALGAGGSDMHEVRELIEQEQADRRFFAIAFAPLLTMTAPRPVGIPGPVVSMPRLRAVWRDLHAACPAEIRAGLADLEYWNPAYDPPLPVMDELCAVGARLLEEQGDDALGLWLRLTPMARQAQGRLTDWLGRATDERIAVLRLIFKDATGVTEDAAPRLMEMVMAMLAEPWQVLRPIALLTDHAGDRYLAASELAGFGERMLDRVDEAIERLRSFDLRGGAAAAREAAHDVHIANAILDEFETSVELSREGPWGKRIAAARKSIAGMIESRLREVEAAVQAALPMQSVRITGRMTRPAPKVGVAPDDRHVQPARALLTLLGETRQAANTGGFGALRTQLAEEVGGWLEIYADELIHLVNGGEAPDQAVAHAYLDIAAEFLELLDNRKAAQVVRRRAAVAGIGAPSQDVA